MDEEDDVDDVVVSSDEIRTMADEIQRGLPPDRSSVSMTETHRQIWDDLADQHFRHR